MVKKVKPEGGELLLPKEKLDEIPIVLSQSKAKALLKQIKPPKPRSEAQIEHMKKVVQANRERWQKEREEKALAEQQAKEQLEKNSRKIIVKPMKKLGPRKPKPPPPIQEDDDAEEDDEEEEEPEPVKAVKKVSKKASELVEHVNQIEEKIKLLKTGNRYDSLLRF
jgi:hypothetical protein